MFCCMDSEANFRKVRMEASQNDLRLVKVNQPMEKETHLMDLGRGHVPRRVSFALLNLQFSRLQKAPPGPVFFQFSQ